LSLLAFITIYQPPKIIDMTTTVPQKLFTPLKLGAIALKHRVIMAPLTRTRSPSGIPNENVVKYYGQRASDGGLLISEATHISLMVGNPSDVCRFLIA